MFTQCSSTFLIVAGPCLVVASSINAFIALVNLAKIVNVNDGTMDLVFLGAYNLANFVLGIMLLILGFKVFYHGISSLIWGPSSQLKGSDANGQSSSVPIQAHNDN